MKEIVDIVKVTPMYRLDVPTGKDVDRYTGIPCEATSITFYGCRLSKDRTTYFSWDRTWRAGLSLMSGVSIPSQLVTGDN